MPSPALDGLSSAAAAQRLASDGPNELPTARPPGVLQQVWTVVQEPMLFLLLGAGTLNFFLAEPFDGALLMASVLVVIAISLYQERRTENALAALRDLSAPRALVLRDGQRVRIPGRDVVQGDIALLSEGDRVPADAVLLEGVNVSVDESALTGESVPVRKAALQADPPDAPMGPPGGDGTPWVFSGTLVVKGHGVALVKGTGTNTELGRIGTALRAITTERTPLQGEIRRLVRFFAVIGLAAAVAVATIYALTRGSWLEGFLAGIATAMALLPEEYPVVLTVFLALGAWRMSQRHVLTRRTPVIEALGSATVICVDKTGTLTLNRMAVKELFVDGIVHVAGGGPMPENLQRIVQCGVLASPVDPFDPMDQAFTALGDHLDGIRRFNDGWTLEKEYPLSDKLLAVTNVWRSPGLDHYVVAAKGAPEAIASLCGFNDAQRREVSEQVDRATADGRRVLALAAGRFDIRGPLPQAPGEFEFTYLGLAALQDPVRPGVPGAIAACSRAGVRVVMITGDYPGTAIAIAREIGLEHPTECITGSELQVMDDAELARRIRTTSVFARMVPEQKLRLIHALKANGEIVGMTGDGVNDAPALRAADIGIAMGLRGTDVARESAALVITDDDFASIVEGIRHGRGIYDKLRKALTYIVAVHVPIVGMSLVPVFVADWPLVLLPVLIAFLEFIIDPACSLVFEAEELDPLVMDQPPRAVGQPMFDRAAFTIAALQGLSAFVAVLAVFLWAVLGDRPDDVVRSITFATLVIGNIALILVNRSWRLPIWRTFREQKNGLLRWVLPGDFAALAAVLVIPPVRDALNLGPLGLLDWGVAVLAGALGVVWFEVYKVLKASPHEGPQPAAG